MERLKPLPDYVIQIERGRIADLRAHYHLNDARRAEEDLQMRMTGKNGNSLSHLSHPRHLAPARTPKRTS